MTKNKHKHTSKFVRKPKFTRFNWDFVQKLTAIFLPSFCLVKKNKCQNLAQ